MNGHVHARHNLGFAWRKKMMMAIFNELITNTIIAAGGGERKERIHGQYCDKR